jgi:hypothetical protein
VVPFDNNIGQRNIVPIAAGGGLRGLLSSFLGRKFTVRNPLDGQARIEIKSELPGFLKERGWGVLLDQRETTVTFALGPGAARDVALELKPGREFRPEEVRQARGGQIRLTVVANGDVIGGMTYDLDHTLQRAPSEREGAPPISLNDAEIEEAIRNAQEETGESVPITAETTSTGDEGGGEMPVTAGSTGTAESLLSELGLGQGKGKVQRVTLRKVLIEVDLAE